MTWERLEEMSLEEMAQRSIETGREVFVGFFGPERVRGIGGEVALMARLEGFICPILELKKRPRGEWAAPLCAQWRAALGDVVSVLAVAGGQVPLVQGVVGPTEEEEWPSPDEGVD